MTFKGGSIFPYQKMALSHPRLNGTHSEEEMWKQMNSYRALHYVTNTLLDVFLKLPNIRLVVRI